VRGWCLAAADVDLVGPVRGLSVRGYRRSGDDNDAGVDDDRDDDEDGRDAGHRSEGLHRRCASAIEGRGEAGGDRAG